MPELLDTEDQVQQLLSEVSQNMGRYNHSLAPVLPLIFRLRNKPYSLRNSHFMFYPMFKVRDVPRRLLMLCGRQVAKCLRIHNTGRVYLANGRPVNGEHLNIGDEVLSLCDQTLTVQRGTISNVFRMDDKPCLRVTTRLGSVIEAADTHPIRIPLGYTLAQDIAPGHRVASLRTGAPFGQGLENEARSVANWLEEEGLRGHRSYGKLLPTWVFDLSESGATTLIQALWSAYGRVKYRTNGYAISYTTTSKTLAYDLKALLLKFRIVTSVRQFRDCYFLRVEGLSSQEQFIRTFTVQDEPQASSSEDTRPEDILWDTVVSVERIPSAPCWDIEVDTYHNYAVDGLVVHNSTTLAASSIIRARSQPFYNSVTVMPLFEQVRKFSNNYVRPFILNSPIKSTIVGDFASDSVLQRDLVNGSSLFYSYSSGDPSRVRGVAADEINFDEAQDLDHQDLAIIEAALSASDFKLNRYSGTPKTFDNTIHILWEDSSQAHWHIPCVCGHVNRCCTDGDLLKMLGQQTLICSKCERPADSRAGYWVHDFPDRQLTFAGYHVPQPILPMHYELPRNWQLILELQREKQPYFFYNEILGESFDTGAKIITAEEVKRGCTVKPFEPRKTPNSRFSLTSLGIDWGGRGKERATDTDEFISNTAFAIAGLNPDLSVDITYLHKVPYSTDASLEASMAVDIARDAKIGVVAMDYGGQGNVQEHAMRARGWPLERVCPFTYSVMRPTRPIVFYVAPDADGVRSSYTLDKPRSILLLCELIKRGHVRLPNKDEYINNHLRDFLNIYEESIENPRGSPTRLVKRMSRRTDDVVHAVNFAVMSLFHISQAWPKITHSFIQNHIIET